MTPEQLAASLENLIIAAESKFGITVERSQRAIWNEVSTILSKLETRSGGYLKQTPANRKIIQQAIGKIDQALTKSGYYQGVGNVVKHFDAISGNNGKYFEFIADAFQPNKGFIKDLHAQAVAEVQTLMANEGLEVVLKRPLTDILHRNLNTGGQLSDLIAEVRSHIIGGKLPGGSDIEGSLLRYSKQITKDTLANYSAGFQQAMVSDLKMEFYKYVGGLIDRSREFCIHRAGKYYHKREVEEWAKESWAGKRKGTTRSSIFIYRGGYNCGHSLVAVDVSTVPKHVVERARKAGYYKG